MRALCDQQVDGSVALQLQGQSAAKRGSRAKEHGSRNGLAEQRENRLRIVRVGTQLAPCSIQAHPMAPNGAVLNDKPANNVAGAGGLFSHSPAEWGTVARYSTGRPS